MVNGYELAAKYSVKGLSEDYNGERYGKDMAIIIGASRIGGSGIPKLMEQMNLLARYGYKRVELENGSVDITSLTLNMQECRDFAKKAFATILEHAKTNTKNWRTRQGGLEVVVS